MAGEIAEALAVPGATLSFHLKELVHAGLVSGENRGRNVCYRARFDAMNGLVAYLTHNCCADSPDEACALGPARSEEHTSELQSLMRISYAVFCLKQTTKPNSNTRSAYTYI